MSPTTSILDELIEICRDILLSAPLLLVYVAGIIVALTRYRRHPKVSTLTMAALIGLVVLNVLLPALIHYLPDALATSGDPGAVARVINFTVCCLQAGLLVLLLMAVFGSRQQFGVRGPDGQYLPPDFLKGEAQK